MFTLRKKTQEQPGGPHVVEWQPQADDLLRKSGNYTLDQIHEEFDREFKLNPDLEKLRVDPIADVYVTPVADRRYSVIWKLKGGSDRKVAVVSAVVPVRFAGEAEGVSLKQRVKNAVLLESGGRLKLDF